MNPALLWIALLAALGLGCKDRGLGWTWCLLGAAGMVLLGPTLLQPGAIPSPAGSLAELPPWQGTGDPKSGNPELRDITFQVEPWLLHLRHELRAGRLPFWNPYHYAGMPYWSNGSAAPLFPLHWLFVVLPLPVGFVLLPWLRMVLGGLGAFVLARELGTSDAGARIAALVFPLSGMLVSHLLFPMANALLLVPWIFWAVERWLGGRGSWRPLALLGGLQLIAGHPETALHTCLLTAVYAGVRGWRGERPWPQALAGLVLGWAVAALLAAVQILPLAHTLFASTRWLEHDPGTRAPLSLVGGQLLRLVVPNAFGIPSQHDFWGPVVSVATAVYVGAIALVLAGSGLARAGQDRRLRGWTAVLLFSFLGAYHLPIFWDLLIQLPLVGRAPQHRLIFGIELALALSAAAGFDRWRAGQRTGLMAVWAGVVALLAASWWHFAGEWQARGQVPAQASWTLLVLGLGTATWLLVHAPETWRNRAAWLLPGLIVVDLALAHAPLNPPLELARHYPLTPSVRFLQEQQAREQPSGGFRVAGLGGALHANAGMVYGLRDVRGDESIKMARYEAYFAALARPEPIYSLPVADWQHPRLDALGVRWVVAGPDQAAPVGSWELAFAGADARVYQRPTALPLVRWSAPDPSSRLTVQTRLPGRWEVTWQSSKQQELRIAECWDPGWRAWIDGHEVTLSRVDDLFLGVTLRPGAGRLELRYRPHGLGLGLGLSGLAGAVLLALWFRERRIGGSAVFQGMEGRPPCDPL